MEDKFVDSEDIANYVYNKLISYGLIATEEESMIISDIIFDYLIDAGLIEEIDDLEDLV